MKVRWPIVRTSPGHHRGFAIPVFIHNRDDYLDALEIYADGAIDAWGMLDRALLACKVTCGGVALAPPPGAHIGVHDLGRIVVGEVAWAGSPGALLAAVDDAIATLNPEGRDLVDMEGSASVVRDGMRHATAKMPKSTDFALRLGADGGEIHGQQAWVLRPGAVFELVPWFQFSDGLSQVGTDGDLEPLEATSERIRAGALVFAVPDGAWMSFPGLGRVRCERGFFSTPPEEHIKSAFDALKRLRGVATTVEVCRAALDAYARSPDEVAQAALREAYEAIPSHHRCYIGDMDTRDHDVRRVLFPSEFADDDPDDDSDDS